MGIKDEIKKIKNTIIDKLLNSLEKNKMLDSKSEYIDLKSLNDEQRQKAFREFSEGNDDMYQLLTTEYNNGIE